MIGEAHFRKFFFSNNEKCKELFGVAASSVRRNICFLCMKHLIVAIPFANSISKSLLLDGYDSKSAKRVPQIIRVQAI